MATETKTPREIEMERKESEVKQENEKRSGVGVRMRVGQTRGKNPQIITWEAFDDSLPETLPKTVGEFLSLTKLDPAKDDAKLTSYLIAGYNDEQYTAASDPLKEFVDPSWPDDAQTQFRLVVRNYSRGASVSLEDAVALIKPGFVKQFSKS